LNWAPLRVTQPYVYAEGTEEDAEIHTIERNDELEDLATGWFKLSEYGHKITLHIGNALELIPHLEGTFDLAFLDADKREYIEYYETIFPKIPSGGFILADNTLWNGKLVEEISHNDAQSIAISDFNNYIANDSRIEKVILPLRDGLTIIHKK